MVRDAGARPYVRAARFLEFRRTVNIEARNIWAPKGRSESLFEINEPMLARPILVRTRSENNNLTVQRSSQTR